MNGTPDFWDRLASISDDRGEYWPNLDKRVGKWNKIEEDFIHEMIKGNDKKILDVGCGDGRTLLWLRKSGFKNLYGFDISKVCVHRAKEKLGGYAKLKVRDFNKKVPFNQKFDYILLTGNTIIIGDIKNPGKVLGNIKRVLKEGGKIVITCWNGKYLNKKFVESYYGKLGVIRYKGFDSKSRLVFFEGFTNKWLTERELKEIIKNHELKILEFRKSSLGFLCVLSR